MTADARGAAIYAPGGRCCARASRFAQPELADALERLGAEGAAPFYTGDIARGDRRWLAERGGLLTRRGPRGLRAWSTARPVRAPTAAATC